MSFLKRYSSTFDKYRAARYEDWPVFAQQINAFRAADEFNRGLFRVDESDLACSFWQERNLTHSVLCFPWSAAITAPADTS
jgi:hypothetical protein